MALKDKPSEIILVNHIIETLVGNNVIPCPEEHTSSTSATTSCVTIVIVQLLSRITLNILLGILPGTLRTRCIGVASLARHTSHKCDLAHGHLKELTHCLKPEFLARPMGWPSLHNLGIVLAFLQMISPVLANEDSTMQISSDNVVWPFGDGSAGLVVSLILAFNFCTRLWPKSFESSAMSIFLLSFSTLGVYYVLPDITTSNALLLRYATPMSHKNDGLWSPSILLLQFNLSLFLVRGRHKVKPGHHYTMSVQ